MALNLFANDNMHSWADLLLKATALESIEECSAERRKRDNFTLIFVSLYYKISEIWECGDIM